MHQHIIAAAHAAAAAQSASPDRGILAFGVAALVFVVGVTATRKKKPAGS
jgi:hypothetical protein